MISTNNPPEVIQSLNELVSALSEGERTTFDNIIRSSKLQISDLEAHCSWSQEAYTRNCIVENEKFELILLCWEKGQFTPIHTHGGEECWVKVIEGEFEETIYKESELGELNVVKTGVSKFGDTSYMIDFMGSHRLKNSFNQRSMSLHLYAKPIRNCKIYDEDRNEFVSKELVYDTVSESMKNLKH